MLSIFQIPNIKCPIDASNTNTQTQLLVVLLWYRIDGVMVSVLASSAVDRGFETQTGQTKDYKIGICCLSSTNASLGERATTDLVGIMIICPSEAT